MTRRQDLIDKLSDLMDRDNATDFVDEVIAEATTYRPDHNGECLNCDEPADAHTADGRCLTTTTKGQNR